MFASPTHKKKRKKEKKSKHERKEHLQITDVRHIKEETFADDDDAESFVKEEVEEPAHVEAHSGTQALPGAGVYWSFSFFLFKILKCKMFENSLRNGGGGFLDSYCSLKP